MAVVRIAYFILISSLQTDSFQSPSKKSASISEKFPVEATIHTIYLQVTIRVRRCIRSCPTILRKWVKLIDRRNGKQR